jgi:regulatory protein SWI6
MPGSALRLLNQGRAQGLFTPSTSTLNAQRPTGYASPGTYYLGNGFAGTSSSYSSMPGISPTPPPTQQQPLKRARSDTSVDTHTPFALAASPDIQNSRPPSTTSREQEREADGPPPTKRTRTEPSGDTAPNSPGLLPVNGILSRPNSSQSLHALTNGKAPQLEATDESQDIRFATKATVPHGMDLTAPLSDGQRSAIVAHICQRDQPDFVLESLRAIAPDNPPFPSDIDIILDDQGHTALHLAASMARHNTVAALLAEGADIHRGNYNGETPLVRATLATANYDSQTFHILVATLHNSIRTLDTSKKSIVHHVVSSAGVKGRALAARYYLEQIFFWIAQHQGGDFKSLVDLQDEHGDTALNIAARVGNRSIVRTLMDVGANRILPNKLGLRPGDFGVETEVIPL